MEMDSADLIFKEDNHREAQHMKKEIGQQQHDFASLPIKPEGLFTRMTLSYLSRIVDAGNEQKYTEDMLYQVEPHFTYRGASTKLKQIMASSSGRMTWSTIFWFSFDFTSRLSCLDILDNILSLVVAFITSKLIDWIQIPNPEFSDGAVLTSLVVASSFAKVFIYNWHTMYFYEIQKYMTNGLKVRSTS